MTKEEEIFQWADNNLEHFINQKVPFVYHTLKGVVCSWGLLDDPKLKPVSYDPILKKEVLIYGHNDNVETIPIVKRAKHLEKQGFGLILGSRYIKNPYIRLPNGEQTSKQEIMEYFKKNKPTFGDAKHITLIRALEYLDAYNSIFC